MDDSIYHHPNDSTEESADGFNEQEDEDIQILGFNDSEIEGLIKSNGEDDDPSAGRVGVRGGGGR